MDVRVTSKSRLPLCFSAQGGVVRLPSGHSRVVRDPDLRKLEVYVARGVCSFEVLREGGPVERCGVEVVPELPAPPPPANPPSDTLPVASGVTDEDVERYAKSHSKADLQAEAIDLGLDILNAEGGEKVKADLAHAILTRRQTP